MLKTQVERKLGCGEENVPSPSVPLSFVELNASPLGLERRPDTPNS